MQLATIDIVHDLIARMNLFVELSAILHVASGAEPMAPSVSLAYSRTTFRLHDLNSLFLEFAIDQDMAGKQSVSYYCVEQHKMGELKTRFTPLTLPVSRNSINSAATVPCNDSTLIYLEIAESIARCGYQCANGDEYRPGYFSEILVDKEKVILRQVNHMNAKSLDHKKNYSLRELKFTIPLVSSIHKPLGFEEESIGLMRIHFSDRSSENNRHCGRDIRKKIEEEKAAFKSTI